MLLGHLGNAAAISLTQHGDDLLVGESALSHRLFLSHEEPSFQKLLVRKSRAGNFASLLTGANPNHSAFWTLGRVTYATVRRAVKSTKTRFLVGNSLGVEDLE